jgi:hypothetical protein
MSEELNKEDAKKKATSKKREFTEQYQYIPGENEELIMDKPSEPLNKLVEEPISIKEINSKVKSNKELYESYIKELKKFSLSINGDVIYDSSIDKTGESPVKFENDYFILYGKKYSYNGLKIQKINIR